MIFRESKPEDFEYMATHSMNQTVDRKQEETIDYCYTLEHEDKPLGLGGFRMITPTTCWIWCDISKDSMKNIKTILRTAKEWIEVFVSSHKINRIQAFVKCSSMRNMNFVSHLGLSIESKMENFSDGEPYYLYVKFFDGVWHGNQSTQE